MHKKALGALRERNLVCEVGVQGQVEGRRRLQARGLCVAEDEAEGRRVGVWGGIVVRASFLLGLVRGRQELDLAGLCSLLFSSSNYLLFDLLPAFTRHISTCQGIPEFPQMWPWCTALQAAGPRVGHHFAGVRRHSVLPELAGLPSLVENLVVSS